METKVIKEKLHRFVDKGDEKLLKMLYAVASEYSEDEDYIFSDADIQELERRRDNRLSGISKNFSWHEAKQIITAK